MKGVASPGSMHDTGCLGLVHWDDPEGWYGEGRRRFRMGNTCIPVADSFWYLAKPIQYCKVKIKLNLKNCLHSHLIKVFERSVSYYIELEVKWSRSVVSDSLLPSGLPFPSPGDLPDPGIEPGFPALGADTLTSEPPEKPPYIELNSFQLWLWLPSFLLLSWWNFRLYFSLLWSIFIKMTPVSRYLSLERELELTD